MDAANGSAFTDVGINNNENTLIVKIMALFNNSDTIQTHNLIFVRYPTHKPPKFYLKEKSPNNESKLIGALAKESRYIIDSIAMIPITTTRQVL